MLFTRIGTFQDPNASYLSSIAQVYGIKDSELYDAKYLVGKIIENLDPLVFISLNGGELWRHFIDIDTPLDQPPYFRKWCETYKDAVDFFLNGSKDLKTSRPELDNLVKVFISFENFKLYCGDFNVPKLPIFFVDLFSRKWCDLQSLNITVLNHSESDKLFLDCPMVDDYSLIYKPSNKTCLLYETMGLYEPIIAVKSLEGFYKPILYSQFSQDLVKLLKFTMVQNILQLSLVPLANCKYDTHLVSVHKLIKKYKDRIVGLVYDETFRGVGVKLENGLLVHSLSFGLVDFAGFPRLNEVELMPPNNLIDLIEKELGNRDEIKLLVHGKNVVGLFYFDSYYDTIPDKKEKFKEFNQIDVELDNVNNNLNQLMYNELSKRDVSFEQLKNELSHFFTNNKMKESRMILSLM